MFGNSDAAASDAADLDVIFRASAFACMHLFAAHEMNKSLIASINFLFIFSCQIVVMDPTKIGLFDVAEKRLVWTAQRQSVLASNIANANTPGFQARDIQSFEAVLSGQSSVEPARTQLNHMTGTLPTGLASLTMAPPKARGVDGNTVALDQQLTKVADTETTQALVTTVWKKYVGMFNLALGRSS
jgi:flagellar basal-body rod protein FlgB